MAHMTTPLPEPWTWASGDLTPAGNIAVRLVEQALDMVDREARGEGVALWAEWQHMAREFLRAGTREPTAGLRPP